MSNRPSPLNLQSILETARALSEPGADFGPEAEWRPALEVLLGSIREEARLGPVREHMAASTLSGLLASRAPEQRLRQQRPELFQGPVERPVFVVGLPRSGTTMLHNLLATHPGHVAYDLWQLRSPARAATEPRAALVQEVESMLSVLRELAPDFARIHPLHAQRPDECNWAFRPGFQTLVLAFQFHVPGYMRFLLEADQGPAYRRYREQLALLGATQDQAPGRLVLKDPCHLWHLDALLAAFPDARIVRLRRDLRECLPSFCSLCFALQSMNAEFQDREAVGRYCLEMAREGLRRADEAQERHPGRIIDVRYADLVGDPLRTVAALCEQIGSPVDDGVVWRLEDWLADNRQHKAGHHRYTPEQYGLSAEQLR